MKNTLSKYDVALTGLENLVDLLGATNSRLEKESILKNCSEETPNWIEIADWVILTHNPFERFHVSSASVKKHPELSVEHDEDLLNLLLNAAQRTYSGHDLIGRINYVIESRGLSRDLVYKIIDRDLKCGTGRTTFNKFLHSKIPSFDVALAGKYEPKYVENWDEWFASRKLDGCRCIIIKNGDEVNAFSRQGKEFEVLGVILDEVRAMKSQHFILDGEICLVDENGNEDFAGIMKQIRKKNHTILNPRLYVFDVLTNEEFEFQIGDVPLAERMERFHDLDLKSDHIELLEQIPVKNDDVVQEMLADAIDRGHEGLILRKNAGYIGKRSRDILKVKKFYDAEYDVVEVIEGTKQMLDSSLADSYIGDQELHAPPVDGLDWEGQKQPEPAKMVDMPCMSAAVIMHKGNRVGVGSGWSDAQRLLYKDHPEKLIGNTITVQYFEESKDQNGNPSLRFPVVKHVYGEEGRDV